MFLRHHRHLYLLADHLKKCLTVREYLPLFPLHICFLCRVTLLQLHHHPARALRFLHMSHRPHHLYPSCIVLHHHHLLLLVIHCVSHPLNLVHYVLCFLKCMECHLHRHRHLLYVELHCRCLLPYLELHRGRLLLCMGPHHHLPLHLL